MRTSTLTQKYVNGLAHVYIVYEVESQKHNKQINYTQDSFKEKRGAALGGIRIHDIL